MPGVRIWEDTDVLDLFAWVDFCLLNGTEFKETVLRHLNDTRQHRSNDCVILTWVQVKQKLLDKTIDIANQAGLGEKRLPVSHIIASGTSSIVGLSQSYKEQIKKRVASYKSVHTPVANQIHQSPPSPPNKPHTTHQHRGNHSQTSDARHGSHSAASKKTLKLQDRAEQKQTRVRRGRSDDSDQASLQLSSRQNGTVTLHTDSQPALAPPSAQTGQASSNMKLATELQTRQLRQKDHEIARIRAQWQLDTDRSAEREYKLAQEVKELRAQNTNHVLARQDRERAGTDYLEAGLFNNTHELWKLARRVEEMIKAETFTRQTLPGGKMLDPKTLDNAMDQIASELECIVPPQIAERITFASVSELGALVRTISIGSAGQEEEARWLRMKVLKFEAETVVRALAIGALRDWVFSGKFPNFVPEDTRLLGAYREIVAQHGGWKRLHNLDLAAHGILINRSYTKKTVERKAEELASRFSRALEPLFTTNTSDSDFASWDEDHDTSEDRRFRLMGIFKAALQLKVETVTADMKYEFVLYPLGTTHTPAADGLGGPAAPGGLENSPEQFWQYASMHTYPVASVGRNHLADGLVSPNNFVSETVEKRAESSLYTKFIIATKKEQLGSRPVAVSNTQNRSVNSTKTTGHRNGKSTNHEQKNEVEVMPVRPERSHYSNSRKSRSPTRRSETVDNSRIRSETRRDSTDSLKLGTKPLPTCKHCGTEFAHKHSMTRHVKNNCCIRCTKCGQAFRHSGQLKLHLKEDNCTQKECDPVPDSEAESTDKEANQFGCDVCEKTFGNKHAVSVHKGIVHRKRTYMQALEDECEGEVIGDVEMETKPKPSAGPKAPHVCVCGKQYSYWKSFENHKKDSCSQCSNCQQWFSDQRAFAEHHETEHLETEQDLPPSKSHVDVNDRPKEDQKHNSRPVGSQPSTSTISHEEDAHNHKKNNSKRLRRNSTRQARPDSYRDDSDSDVEVIESRSTEAGNLADEQHPRETHGEEVKRAENGHPLGGVAAQGDKCEICSKNCASVTELKSHRTAHSICLQQGHFVTPSTSQQGQSHSQCDRCGMTLKNANLRDRYGNVPTKSVARHTGGSKKRDGEVAESFEETRARRDCQDQPEDSFPRITNQQIVPRMDGEVMTAENTGWPIMVPPPGSMNGNRSVYSPYFNPSGNM